MQDLHSFSPFGALRHHLPPAERWDNKAPRGCNPICGSILCTGCCAPACGGKVVAPATKGGRFSIARRAVVKVLYKLAPSIILKAPTTPSEPCEPFAPFEPSRPQGVSITACPYPMAKPPGLSSWGFCSSLSLRGKGPGLYPQITVLRLSNHPAWRDEGGVMNEVKPFSGLPWPGVRGGILPPVSFQP